MAPAGLNNAQLGRIGKMRYGLAQKIGVGHKIGVKYGDKLAAGRKQAIGQRAGFKAGPLPAMDQLDVDSLRPVKIHPRLGQLGGFIGGVIEHLNLQQMGRIIEPDGGVDQPFNHQRLVEHRQLHSDRRQVGGSRGRWRGGRAAAVQAIQQSEHPRVEGVYRQQQRGCHVNYNQNCHRCHS